MSDASNQRIASSGLSLSGANWGRLALRTGAVIVLLAAGGVITLVGERLIGAGVAPNEVRVTTFQDWRLLCPPLTAETPNCALTSEVTRAPGGTLLTVAMTDPSPGSALSLTVPHGVLLESGLGFAIGSEPMRVRPYETCTAQGCIALVTVDADTLKALTTGAGGQVTVAPLGATQPINIPFSLKGFADGYGELQRAKARRSGFFSFLARS
jgi:invasion protein IalB